MYGQVTHVPEKGQSLLRPAGSSDENKDQPRLEASWAHHRQPHSLCLFEESFLGSVAAPPLVSAGMVFPARGHPVVRVWGSPPSAHMC